MKCGKSLAPVKIKCTPRGANVDYQNLENLEKVEGMDRMVEPMVNLDDLWYLRFLFKSERRVDASELFESSTATVID